MRLDMTKKNITPRVGKAHKTDILFVYPPISVSERYGKKVSEVGGNLPPLGVAYLAAYAREKGYDLSNNSTFCKGVPASDNEDIAHARSSICRFSPE